MLWVGQAGGECSPRTRTRCSFLPLEEGRLPFRAPHWLDPSIPRGEPSVWQLQPDRFGSFLCEASHLSVSRLAFPLPLQLTSERLPRLCEMEGVSQDVSTRRVFSSLRCVIVFQSSPGPRHVLR